MSNMVAENVQGGVGVLSELTNKYTSLLEENKDAETVLRPYVMAYCEMVYAKRYKDLDQFYHPDAVLVETGKKVYHSSGDIATAIENYREALLPAETKLIKETYGGCGDVLCYRNQWEMVTETEVLKGPYLQVWKRHGNVYMLHHDEFCIESRTTKT